MRKMWGPTGGNGMKTQPHQHKSPNYQAFKGVDMKEDKKKQQKNKKQQMKS